MSVQHEDKTSLFDLPPELIDIIVSHPRTKDAMLGLVLTCRRFSTSVTGLSLRHHIKQDPSGAAPLHWACEKNLLGVAKKALELGADPLELFPPRLIAIFQHTFPLAVAVANSNVPLVKLFLDYGAHGFALCEDQTVFSMAVTEENSEIVHLLLAQERKDSGVLSDVTPVPGDAITVQKSKLVGLRDA